MTGVEILDAWYKRIWVENDLGAIHDYFDVDALANGLMPDGAVDIADFMAIVPAVQRLIRNIEVSLDLSMESDDKAWALITMKAQRAQDLADVSLTGQVMIRTKNNKIIEAYNHFDFIGFFEKLGSLPQDTLALCLSGEELT
jgi:hypothetical protein